MSDPNLRLLEDAVRKLGIYAVGDVQSGSEKRVASAVGEGSAVVADIHRYLAEFYEWLIAA